VGREREGAEAREKEGSEGDGGEAGREKIECCAGRGCGEKGEEEEEEELEEEARGVVAGV